jgi:hypothetical protein
LVSDDVDQPLVQESNTTASSATTLAGSSATTAVTTPLPHYVVDYKDQARSVTGQPHKVTTAMDGLSMDKDIIPMVMATEVRTITASKWNNTQYEAYVEFTFYIDNEV